MSLIFYDFEVFPNFWCVTCASIGSVKGVFQFSSEYDKKHKNRTDLCKFYEEHKGDIWIGYNNKAYDQWMMKALLAGFGTWQMNTWLIDMGKNGWEFSSVLNQYPMINYDCLQGYRSLKELEGFMGERIKETPVDFRKRDILTPEEIEMVFQYNEHDVEQTMKVFFEQESDFDAMMSLVTEYNLPLSYIGKTKAGIVGTILGCKRQSYDDEWDISLVDTLRIKKYAHVVNWYKDSANYKLGEKLNVHVAGVLHTFGLGGIHGAVEKCHATGLLVHVDVGSMYPSIMIRYNLLSRSVTKPELFKQIYDKRLALKAAGKKKEQAPYKIILNSMFGISGAKFSDAYDPRRNHEVCINGQLLTLDLIEHLEPYCRLIQSNTDGLIIQIPDTDEAWEKIDDVCYEWEKRTGLKLSFDVIKEIFQKDVNNYLFITDDGKIETKGAYLKEKTSLDNDLPVVSRAMVEFMLHKTSPEKTISEANNLMEYQKIVKRSSKYENAWHNGEILHDKTFRVFASTRPEDGFIGKQKTDGATIEKFGNTPDKCFIYNDNVQDVAIPEYLDKKYYVDLAYSRLEDFGIASNR